MRHILEARPVRWSIIALLLGVLAFVLLAPAAVFAQGTQPEPFAVPGVVNVNWTPPTQTECLDPAATDPATCARLPLTGELALTAIELYVAQAPIADDFAGEPTAFLEPGLTRTTYNGMVPAGSTLYFRVKARNKFASSKFSVQASKVIEVPHVAPGAPTNVTVEITIGVVPPSP